MDHVLKIRLLGRFSMEHEGHTVAMDQDATTKPMQMFQILAHQREEGISRYLLIHRLFGEEESADMANKLRVNSYRLKQILKRNGWPEYDYIRLSKGVYHLDFPVEVEVDTKVFVELIEEAMACEDRPKKIKLLTEACDLYQGDFLPHLSEKPWVKATATDYKDKYSKALTTLTDMLKEDGQFEEAIRLAQRASRIYPFDEWQSVSIECYIRLHQYEKAMQLYEDTAKLFVEELGVHPSEKVMRFFEELGDKIDIQLQDIAEIKQRLKEDSLSQKGALFCTLPVFRAGYRLMVRMENRGSLESRLMVLNLVEQDGSYIANVDRLQRMSDLLVECLQNNLRAGDFFTKYTAGQFVVLLMNVDEDTSRKIYKRIRSSFGKQNPRWRSNLECHIESII